MTSKANLLSGGRNRNCHLKIEKQYQVFQSPRNLSNTNFLDLNWYSTTAAIILLLQIPTFDGK